jgi:sulfate permease, SulP family
VVYLLLGLLRMGWISNFLSKAVLGGFVLGFAIGIIIDQSQKLLGIDKVSGPAADAPLPQHLDSGADRDGPVHPGRAGVRPGRRGRGGDRVCPHRPVLDRATGVGWSEAGALVAGALSVVFVGYSESLASARAKALKHRYEIDPDQKLIAQGMGCGAAGFVGGFATDGSLSKTSVADLAGQKTQMASLVNALSVLLTILFIDIIHGILIGVVLSLLLLIARASTPGVRRLGREPNLDVWVDVDRYTGIKKIPGVVAVRMGGPLFFADANRFRDAVNEMISSNRESRQPLLHDARRPRCPHGVGAPFPVSRGARR